MFGIRKLVSPSKYATERQKERPKREKKKRRSARAQRIRANYTELTIVQFQRIQIDFQLVSLAIYAYFLWKFIFSEKESCEDQLSHVCCSYHHRADSLYFVLFSDSKIVS